MVAGVKAMNQCESCSMLIEAGQYCQHCTNENGELQSFDERFEKMVSFLQRKEPQLSSDEVEMKTKAYMRTMPAWKNHPMLLVS